MSFHPYLTTDTASSSFQGLVYAAGLEKRNPDTLKPEPLMAESWDISPDLLTYTFHLRKDMKWSDGVPLTSDDFKWTFDQSNKPENEYPYRENFDFIKSYEAPDPYTLKITVKEKFCPALEGVDAVTPLPRHIWEKLDWKDPEKNPEIMHPSVVSGPFKLKEWVKDDHAIFVANDTYFLGRPKLDTYTIRIVPEQGIAYTMLKSGEVDSAPVTPEQYAEAKANPNLQDVRVVAGGRELELHRLQPAPRRAEGRARPARAELCVPAPADRRQGAEGAGPPALLDHRAQQRVLQCRGAALRLQSRHGQIAAEGSRLYSGGDGSWSKDGQTLKLKLIYGPNTSKTREQIAVVTQAEFKKLGIDVDIQGLEWGAFLKAQSSEPFDWDLTVNGWASTLDPHWMWQIWDEKFIPDLNYVAYVNKQGRRPVQPREDGMRQPQADLRPDPEDHRRRLALHLHLAGPVLRGDQQAHRRHPRHPAGHRLEHRAVVRPAVGADPCDRTPACRLAQ